jgi:hypothetical protein
LIIAHRQFLQHSKGAVQIAFAEQLGRLLAQFIVAGMLLHALAEFSVLVGPILCLLNPSQQFFVLVAQQL